MPPVKFCGILETIRARPGLRVSELAKALDIPLRRVEDVVWNLWKAGDIQMDPDSTLRVTRFGERVFRYDL